MSCSSKLSAAIGAVLLAASASHVCQAASINNLGTAAGYAALGLSPSGGVPITISSGNTVINGNVGVGNNGSLNFSGGGNINGNVVAGTNTTLTITGGSSYTSLVTNSPALSQNQTDALNAASQDAALTPTQTVVNIGNNTTFNGSGSTNVIDVTGNISLSAGGKLTLTGGANDVFIFQVHGTTTFSGGSDIVLNGISANQVLFDILGTGSSGAVNSNGNSDLAGIFLAPNANITISGGVHTAEFISGTSLVLQSGPTITAPPHSPSAPEPGTYILTGIGFAGLIGLSRCVRRKTRS